MLPKGSRLISDYDFRLTKEKGEVVKGRFFLILFYFRNDKETSRFGFIVSTKVSKKSVERNKIKRLLRESIKSLLFQVKDGYNIIFVAYKNCLTLKRELFFGEVKMTLESKGLLK